MNPYLTDIEYKAGFQSVQRPPIWSMDGALPTSEPLFHSARAHCHYGESSLISLELATIYRKPKMQHKGMLWLRYDFVFVEKSTTEGSSLLSQTNEPTTCGLHVLSVSHFLWQMRLAGPLLVFLTYCTYNLIITLSYFIQ